VKNKLQPLLFVILALCSTYAMGQGWPLPADQPGIDVKCTPCGGTPTKGYSSPLIGYAGRYLDSQSTGDQQQTFRTARANQFFFYPAQHRLYMRMGSALAAYNSDTFFQRLIARETLFKATGAPVNPPNIGQGYRSRDTNPEVFLYWNKFFYAENTGSGWDTPIIDGQTRLVDFDFDDRGYLYLASTVFSWGIVKDDFKDDGNIMVPIHQHVTTNADVQNPELALSLKTSDGRYYVLISSTGVAKFDVYDVTTPASPVRMPAISRGMVRFARNVTRDRIALLGGDGSISIFTPEGLLQNNPLTILGGGGSFLAMACDGTNFYGVSYGSGGGIIITTIKPSGASTNYTTSTASFSGNLYSPMRLGANAGYLSLLGNTEGGIDLRLFKTDGNAPVEVPMHNYVRDYYTNPPAGYAKAAYINALESLVITQGASTYLMISANGLGDVYKLLSGDSLTVAAQGSVGTLNPNAPARPTGTVYYGDKASFIATTSATAPATITWSFGNAETVSDPNSASGTTGVPATHQYSGLTTANVSASRQVSATTGSITGSTLFSLTAPVARFGVMNASGLKVGNNVVDTTGLTGRTLVAGDQFFDASDGDVDGHFTSWNVDGTIANTVPYAAGATSGYAVSAGACSAAAHTLSFDAHYGAHSGFTPIGADYAVGIHNITYRVAPFGGTISSPTSDATTVSFTGAVRATADTSVLSAVQAAALSWNWDLVDGNDAVVTAGPAGTGVNVTPWTINKSTLTTRGLRVRLKVTSGTPVTGSCAGLGVETSKTYSAALNTPDPSITGDCANGGPPCVFTAASLSNVNMTSDGWTLSWGVNTAAVVLGSTTGTTFSPTFTSVGNFVVSLTATNPLGVQVATKNVNVTVAGSTCNTMTASNVFVTYSGNSSSCAALGGACSPGESITFNASRFTGYDFGCAPHTFNWTFGDGGTAVGQTVTHAFNAASTYTVTCTVNNGSQTFAATQAVSVGAVTPTPPITPPTTTPPVIPPSGGCSTMTSTNVFVYYTGSNADCNPISGGNCTSGSNILFSASSFGYSFFCATHSFSWSFGDGQTGSGQNANHTYSAPGNYTATLTVNNGAQSFSANALVKVTGGTTPGPVTPTPDPTPSGSCGAMTSNSVFVTYTGSVSGCSTLSGTCQTNEGMSFAANSFAPYHFTCATHSFTWDFGDGSATATGQTASHTYANQGTYHMKVTVNNGSQSFDALADVKVGPGGSPATIINSMDFTITPWVISGVRVPNGYVFTPSSDPVGSVKTWQWDFGDGKTQITKTADPGHGVTTNAYATDASYTITMTTPDAPAAGAVVKSLPKPIRRRPTGVH
jgi:PKD repeat protein